MKPRSRGLFLVLALVAGYVGAATPAQAVIPIQPGTRMSLVKLTGDMSGWAMGTCTLGFVFDGKGELDGKVFLAIAAHCATEVGDDVMLLETGEVFGDIAVKGGDIADVSGREGAADDWALIEVRPEFYDRVSPAIEGYPEFPTGYTKFAKTNADDAIRQTDWPDSGANARESVLVEDTKDIYVIAGDVIPFDSGGPLAHIASGKALGLVSQGENCPPPSSFGCESYLGPTLQGVLARAAGAGFPVTLRTV